MDIILAMLADEASEKMSMRKWDRFPTHVERNAEVNEYTQNFALYRYLVNKAIRYPKEWIDNQIGAKALVNVGILDKEVVINKIEILNKSENIEDSQVVNEVKKTLKLASHDFPQSHTFTKTDLVLEWKAGFRV